MQSSCENQKLERNCFCSLFLLLKASVKYRTEASMNPHPPNPASGYKRGSSLSSGPLRGESPPKDKDACRFKRYWFPDHAFGANSAL